MTGAFARLFGSAVAMQALLSATSLLVGLILIRRASDAQYGYFVLASNFVMLITSLQQAFIQSHMVVRLTGASPAAQAELVGGLYRDQRRFWPRFAAVAAAAAAVCSLTTLLEPREAIVALAAILAGLGSLFREFFRMVLLALRRPVEVIKGDLLYAAILVGGVLLATLTPVPATVAALGLALAAGLGGASCRSSLWRLAPWNIGGAPGILRAIAPLGLWTAAGSAIHWLFGQGYNFLVAGILGVGSVAAISATRILIMPVNLLSTGIGTIMLPTVSAWLQHHGAGTVFKRQMLIAGTLAGIALAYFGLLWACRDWVFTEVLKKPLEDRDELLLLWYAISLLMLLRDQCLYMLLSRSRFRVLTLLTLGSALVALGISCREMPRLGAAGALIGVFAGEVVNVTGLILLSLRETRRPVPIEP